MIDLSSQPGEFTFNIQIKRADTGKTEDYTLIGKVLPEENLPDEPIEQQNKE